MCTPFPSSIPSSKSLVFAPQVHQKSATKKDVEKDVEKDKSQKKELKRKLEQRNRRWMHQKLIHLFTLPIHFYRRYISPLKPPSCRFTPTCSQYALDAYQHYGIFKGTWLTFTRILRCHPWHPGGHDPVVPYEQKK